MKIYIGSDHRGFELKGKLINWLKSQDHDVEDCGNTKYDPLDDYVDFANAVSKHIVEDMMKTGGPTGGGPNGAELSASTEGTREGQDPSKSLGIVICGSGAGVSVAANRHKGIICVLGFDPNQVRHARANDHANILSLPSDYVDFEKSKEIVTAFLEATPKTDEKYLRRAKKLDSPASS